MNMVIGVALSVFSVLCNLVISTSMLGIRETITRARGMYRFSEAKKYTLVLWTLSSLPFLCVLRAQRVYPILPNNFTTFPPLLSERLKCWRIRAVNTQSYGVVYGILVEWGTESFVYFSLTLPAAEALTQCVMYGVRVFSLPEDDFY